MRSIFNFDTIKIDIFIGVNFRVCLYIEKLYLCKPFSWVFSISFGVIF